MIAVFKNSLNNLVLDSEPSKRLAKFLQNYRFSFLYFFLSLFFLKGCFSF